jgi:hypothetical protein
LNTIGKFKINESFKNAARGLVIIGEDIEGHASAGSYIIFTHDTREITLKIAEVEALITVSGRHLTGLIFNYKDQAEQKEFESIKMKEQIVEIKNGLI